MEIQEIIDKLQINTRKFPREALKQAVLNQETITPKLLEIIDHDAENMEEIHEQKKYMAHIYAMYLLAQFREKKAYPVIIKFFSVPGEMPMKIAGDVITEDLGRILASVSHGDTSLIKPLIENADLNEYVRCAGLTALLTLVAQGQLLRDDLVEYLTFLFRGNLYPDNDYIWTSLVTAAVRLYPQELYEDIKRLYEEGLVEGFFVGFGDVQRSINQGKKKTLRELKNSQRHAFIGDTVSEMEWWACFDQPKGRTVNPLKSPKIGRNQLCTCGSGKKYKRCCGKKY
ncbi:DUF1186 domain-containing protein [Anaerolineales bacterium HSG6]|nr:DUF1186 domain-containing protein [Anaerolineales bacterium HSG6]